MAILVTTGTDAVRHGGVYLNAGLGMHGDAYLHASNDLGDAVSQNPCQQLVTTGKQSLPSGTATLHFTQPFLTCCITTSQVYILASMCQLASQHWPYTCLLAYQHGRIHEVANISSPSSLLPPAMQCASHPPHSDSSCHSASFSACKTTLHDRCMAASMCRPFSNYLHASHSLVNTICQHLI